MIFVSFVFCFFFCFGRRLLASITLKWVVNGSLIFSSCYLALIVSQRENDNWRGRATQSPKTLKGGAANTAAGAFVTQGGSHYQQTKQRWRCVYVDVCVCVCSIPNWSSFLRSNSGRRGATWKPSVVVGSLNFEISNLKKKIKIKLTELTVVELLLI